MECCKNCKDKIKFENSFSEEIAYSEIKISNTEIYRIFKSNIPNHLLKWHWDEEDRIITTESNDWKFQFDNELPIPLTEVFINAGRLHRIIKGTSDLIIKIQKI